MESSTKPLDLTGKTAVVLDAHGIIYQVFHTMREMSGPKGQPTGAAFGFARDVMNVLLNFKPDIVFCAFDMPGPTFRHEFFPEYKANRPPMPEDLRPQMVYVRRIVDALCIARLEKDRYEADDLLATAARRVSDAGGTAILITADKDARQLITGRVSLYNLRKEQLYGAEELQKDWGIRPDQVVDFQTMVGDSTDNVPGIPLIGPKSAGDLLVKYGSLAEIYNHLGEIKGKKGENIASARDKIETTRRLVQLDDHVPIELDWDAGAFRGIDPNRLRDLFREYGFRSLMPKIDQLAEQFGKRVSEWDESLDGMFNLTESKETPPAQPSLFDGDEEEETESLPPEETLDSENKEITENLFRTLETKTETVYPEIETGAEFPANPAYKLIDTPELFETFLETLRKKTLVSIDLETVDLKRVPKARPRFAMIAGIAVSFDAETAYYLPIRGPEGARLLPESETLEQLRPFLESDTQKKIGQNIKFDMIVFRNYGIQLRGILFDTMVADYLLHAGEQRHNLDELAERYLNHTTIKITELIGTGKNQKMMDEVPTEETARYAGEDALVPVHLYPKLLAELRRTPQLLRLMTELEIPLISVLVELETNGIAIDAGRFEHLKREFTKRLAEITGEIHAIVQRDAPDSVYAGGFNINSPAQLQKLLYDDLNLPVLKKTKTGRSTDVEVLEELAGRGYELPAKLMEHRSVTKLIGTYAEPIPELVHPVTHRIHASFNQVVTATGRLSSSDPNLQNIPVRTPEGKEIRRGFVPDSRQKFDTFVSCDYSQIELRVLTHFSKDENLTRAFREDQDIHAAVASQLFGVPIEDVTSEQRRKAKAVNFGLVYGQSAFGLSGSLRIERGEAAEYIRGFFATYPGIRVFFDRVLEECRRNGYVSTILGRRRYIDGVRGARGDKQLNMAERTAINTVIQGSAADLMKLAMVNVSKRLADWNGPLAAPKRRCSSVSVPKPGKGSSDGFLFDMDIEETAPLPSCLFPETFPPRARILLQIHDELLLETKKEDADELAALVVREMELGQPLSVPLKIDAEFGEAWG